MLFHKFNTQYFLKSVVLATAAFLATACQDVIDIDLNGATPKLVIEGSLSNLGDGCTVKLSETIAFDELNDFPAVSGATITISDSNDTYSLEEISDGIYFTETLTGIPGTTYVLSVTVEGTTYTAQSTMPEPKSLDSVLVKTDPDLIIYREDEMLIEIQFIDTPGQENFYHYNVLINDENKHLTAILDDDLEDGEEISTIVLSEGDEDDPEFVSGDLAKVLFYTIDEDVHEYYRTLNEISGGLGTAPANPTSNFDNGALGFFSAHAITSVEIEIP